MNKSETELNIVMNINVNYILTFLFLIIALIGIMGNILVIISLSIDSRMKHSLTNRLIVHVGCCDLIILLFNIPDIIQFVSSINGNWILNELSCKLIRSILVLAEYASVLTMCAITIERFIGIVYPLRSKFLREKKHVTQITLFVWIFSLICASPNLFYLRVITFSTSRRCFLQYSKKSFLENQSGYIIHKSIESTIFYFIPLLIQLYSYVRIATQLFHVDDTLHNSFILINKTNNQRTQIDDLDDEDYYIDNDENTESKITITESPGNCSNGHNNNSRRGNTLYSKPISVNNKTRREIKDYYQSRVSYNALKSRRSVIKMLVVVVLIYFISFSPQVLVFILFDTNAIQPVPKFIQTPYFIAFTMLLITISSASNPIVYAIFCSKFRQSFVRTLRCLCFSSRPTYTCHTNTSIQQLPKRTYHFTEKIINTDKEQINNKNISIQLKDKNNQR